MASRRKTWDYPVLGIIVSNETTSSRAFEKIDKLLVQLVDHHTVSARSFIVAIDSVSDHKKDRTMMRQLKTFRGGVEEAIGKGLSYVRARADICCVILNDTAEEPDTIEFMIWKLQGNNDIVYGVTGNNVVDSGFRKTIFGFHTSGAPESLRMEFLKYSDIANGCRYHAMVPHGLGKFSAIGFNRTCLGLVFNNN